MGQALPTKNDEENGENDGLFSSVSFYLKKIQTVIFVVLFHQILR